MFFKILLFEHGHLTDSLCKYSVVILVHILLKEKVNQITG